MLSALCAIRVSCATGFSTTVTVVFTVCGFAPGMLTTTETFCLPSFEVLGCCDVPCAVVPHVNSDPSGYFCLLALSLILSAGFG